MGFTCEPPWPSKTAKKWSGRRPGTSVRKKSGCSEIASSISRDRPVIDMEPKTAGGSAEGIGPDVDGAAGCSSGVPIDRGGEGERDRAFRLRFSSSV